MHRIIDPPDLFQRFHITFMSKEALFHQRICSAFLEIVEGDCDLAPVSLSPPSELQHSAYLTVDDLTPDERRIAKTSASLKMLDLDFVDAKAPIHVHSRPFTLRA